MRTFGRRVTSSPSEPAARSAEPSSDRGDARSPSSTSQGPAASASGAAHQQQRVPPVQRYASLLHPFIADRIDMVQAASMDRSALSAYLDSFLDRSDDLPIPVLAPGERRRVVEALVHDLIGLGPLEPLLADQSVSDVLVNGPNDIYVERGGQIQRTAVRFRDASHLLHVAQRIAGRVGRRVDEASPMVDARLSDGSRVNVVIPPVAIDGGAISIRRFVLNRVTLLEMAQRRMLSIAMATALRIAVQCRLNVIVSGGTGAGKTTFLNALSAEVPLGERLITIEDAAELQLQQPHVIRLETRPPGVEGTGELTMRSLLVNTLRMRPDRIIVGEVRGAEAIEMLQAMNTGHPGSMSTMHANSPRDALVRLENMLMMGSAGDLPVSVLRRQISGTVDIIVQIVRLRSGHRCVSSITGIAGMEGDTVVTDELWRRRPAADDMIDFECSGRLPGWAKRTEPFGLKEELRKAIASDPAISS